MKERINEWCGWFLEKTRMFFGVLFTVMAVRTTMIYIFNHMNPDIWFYNDKGETGAYFVLIVTGLWMFGIWNLMTWWDERQEMNKAILKEMYICELVELTKSLKRKSNLLSSMIAPLKFGFGCYDKEDIEYLENECINIQNQIQGIVNNNINYAIIYEEEK